ncbi:MAG: T9SS type A sorting domain-containing protein [Chitinophagales bacterium]|nr:T9SS type A sorting domain-containing protein [Chitinophagales bacterium]
MNIQKLILASLCLWNSQLAFSQTWTQKASLPDSALARHHPVTFSIGGYGYLLGGTSMQNPYLSDFYRYDPVTDQWEALPSFPGPPRSYAYAVVYNDKAYMGFGFGPTSDMTDLWEFDPATGVWTEKTPCDCDGRGHPALVEADGKIFVGAGGSAMGNLNDFWEYDIATDTWTQRPDFPSHKRHHPYHFSLNNLVYIAFGHGSVNIGGSTIYNDLHRYDPQTNTWERMADFPGEKRVAGTQFSLNGKGYVLSGEGEDHYYLEEGEFWEYTPELDTWKQLPSWPGSGRWAPGSFVIGNTVYATGGTALLSDGSSENMKDLWAYEFPEVSSTVAPQVQSLQVFPNPATDHLTISADLKEAFQFYILNATGQVVQSGISSNRQVLLNPIPAGLYTIEVVTAQQQYQGRFIR